MYKLILGLKNNNIVDIKTLHMNSYKEIAEYLINISRTHEVVRINVKGVR